MKRLSLILAVLAAAILAAAAGAAAPQPVTITAVETFEAGGAFTASGDVFGAGVTGTEHGTAFSGHFSQGVGKGHDFITYQAEAVFTTTAPAGTFTVKYEGTSRGTSFDPVTGTLYLAQDGNWQITDGTGAWAKLQGTGTFTEPGYLNADGSGGGTLTLSGEVHQ